MQIYFDPAREHDPYALPDGEVFYNPGPGGDIESYTGETLPEGWYWQACFPGCLPDGDPVGPFDTEQDAIEAAQEDNL